MRSISLPRSPRAFLTDPWARLGFGFVFALFWQRVLLPRWGAGPFFSRLFCGKPPGPLSCLAEPLG